jgi:hypothetical protein
METLSDPQSPVKVVEWRLTVATDDAKCSRRRHRTAELEADAVAAGDRKRADVVEREVLDVSVGALGAESNGMQRRGGE